MANDLPGHKPSLLERFGAWLAREPEDREELVELLRSSYERNLLDADVQVPGFRRSEGSVETLLNRYIPALTLLSGMIIGLLAGVSDVLGVFGSGTGILLMVNIMVSYYQTLVKEQVDTYMPGLAGLLGRKQ